MQLESASQSERGHSGPKQRGSFQVPCCSEGQSPDEPLWVPFVCLWVFCPIPDLMCIHSVLCRAKSLQSPLTLSDPMDCSLPAPLSMGFSRQDNWSGLPFPSPEDLPNPGVEPGSPAPPALAGNSLPQGPPGKPSLNPTFPFSCGGIQLPAHLASSQSS